MKSLLISLFLSLTAMFLWQFEIYIIHSGEGLDWLDYDLVSPYLIACLPPIAFLWPIISKRNYNTQTEVTAVVILYLLSVFCFVVGKELNYLLYCRYCCWSYYHFALFLVMGLLTFFMLGYGFWLTTHKLLIPIKKNTIVFISITAIAVIPLSLLTSALLPLYNQTDWVGTVKSGYPVFWITFILGLNGARLAKQYLD